MSGFVINSARRLAAGLATVGILAANAPVAHARGDMFENLVGSWTGGGAITSTNGQRENIRCRVTYDGGGNSLAQDLVCASASFKFNVTASIQRQGGRLSGTWRETTRGVGGNVNGFVRGNQIITTVVGSNFSASLTIVSNGDTQSVGIQTRGGDIAQVAISFRR